MTKFNPWNLIRSFGYAIRGIVYALTTERNLRIHFTAGAFVLCIVHQYYHLDATERAILVLCIGLVIVCELLNTALEKTVDLECPCYHSLAGVAKDIAAGAVLVASVTSVVIACFLLGDMEILRAIWHDILQTPLPWISAGLIGLSWIILPQKKSK